MKLGRLNGLVLVAGSALIFVLAGCGPESPPWDALVGTDADAVDDDTVQADSGQDDVTTGDTTGQEGVIGPAGGEVALERGPAIQVPAGALSTDVTISISKMEWVGGDAPVDAEGNSLAPVSEIWKFGPDGLQFAEPVTVSIPYSEFAGVGRELKVFWSVGDTLIYGALEDATIANGIATVEVTHFSSGFVGFVVSGEDPVDDRLPDGWTFNAEMTQPVAPTFVATLHSNTAIDAVTLELKLMHGDVVTPGFGRLSADSRSFYFFPDHLLLPGADYRLSFKADGKTWEPDFTVVTGAGETAFTGNAQVTSGEQMVSFVPAVESISEPAEYAGSLLNLVRDFLVDTYLFSPVFIDEGDDGVFVLTGAAADSLDFDGDGNYEPNHITSGIRVKGEIRGSYFLINGPISLTRMPNGIPELAVTGTIDHVYISGIVEDAGDDMFSIFAGTVMIYAADCTSLSNYFESGQIKTALGLLCDSDDNDLFVMGGYSALPNDIEEPHFNLRSSGAWGIDVGFGPALQSKYKTLRESQVLVEIFKSGDVAVSSADFLGSISVPDGWETLGTLWETFDTIRFELPVGSELDAGDYTARLIVGLYGYETSFTVE